MDPVRLLRRLLRAAFPAMTADGGNASWLAGLFDYRYGHLFANPPPLLADSVGKQKQRLADMAAGTPNSKNTTTPTSSTPPLTVLGRVYPDLQLH